MPLLTILTTSDLAKMFKVDITTILRWIRTIPDFPTPHKLGKSFLFDADDVQDFWERKGISDAKKYQP